MGGMQDYRTPRPAFALIVDEGTHPGGHPHGASGAGLLAAEAPQGVEAAFTSQSAFALIEMRELPLM